MQRSDKRRKAALQRFRIMSQQEWRIATKLEEKYWASLGDTLGYAAYVQRKNIERASLIRRAGNAL